MKQATELLAEPGRCVHIGDRESDIFQLFCTAHVLMRKCDTITRLVRTSIRRRAESDLFRRRFFDRVKMTSAMIVWLSHDAAGESRCPPI
jgi:hypothetical protein